MEVYILLIILVSPSQAEPTNPFRTPIYSEYVSASKHEVCLELAQKRVSLVKKTTPTLPYQTLTATCQLAPPLKKEQL